MSEESGRRYPGKRYGWYMVVLLTIAYVLSFIDRYILGLLVEPIKADLELSDTQIGLLLGPAFAVFYATMGLPLGLAADRARRTWIVAAGVMVWSLATAASGLARNFLHLFLARVAVGVGEATLSPCAMSMISDSFPREQRGRPIAFYTAALSIGAGLASVASATVLSWTRTIPEIVIPFVGPVLPWQFTFFLVGLPGVVLALFFVFLREPPRHRQIAPPGTAKKLPGLGFTLRYVARRWRVYTSFVSVVCVMTIVAYSQGWLAAMFSRTWGWEAQDYALVNGLILLLLGPPAVNLAGWLSDRLSQRGHDDAPLRIMLAGAVLLVPTGVLGPLMPTATLAFIVLAVNTVGIGLLSATSVTALLNIVPADIRGQAVALYYMVISFAGLLLGPTSVGLLADHVFGSENLRLAVAVVPLLFGLPVLLFARRIRRLYLQELRAITALEAEA